MMIFRRQSTRIMILLSHQQSHSLICTNEYSKKCYACISCYQIRLNQFDRESNTSLRDRIDRKHQFKVSHCQEVGKFTYLKSHCEFSADLNNKKNDSSGRRYVLSKNISNDKNVDKVYILTKDKRQSNRPKNSNDLHFFVVVLKFYSLHFF